MDINRFLDRPHCPYCHEQGDHDASGATVVIKDRSRDRWYCKLCQTSWTATPGKIGRPPIGKRPLTNAERCRRYRKKKKRLAKSSPTEIPLDQPEGFNP